MCYDIPSVVGFCFSFCILFMSCISYHVIMCISFAYVFVSCIRAFSLLSVLQSDTPTSSGAPLLFSFRERVLNALGMDRGLPSGLGTPPLDHLSSFVSFGGRLILQRLTAKASLSLQPNTPSKVAQNPSRPPPSSQPFDHDSVAENRSSFGLS